MADLRQDRNYGGFSSSDHFHKDHCGLTSHRTGLNTSLKTRFYCFIEMMTKYMTQVQMLHLISCRSPRGVLCLLGK